ncbi:hypothetical protein QQP08_004711 [Theobroma cacao]|nr:hypothetical protein QQP08_004711 [Theobroma cacao]
MYGSCYNNFPLLTGSSIGCMHLRGSLWQFGWGSKVNPFVTKERLIGNNVVMEFKAHGRGGNRDGRGPQAHHSRANEVQGRVLLEYVLQGLYFLSNKNMFPSLLSVLIDGGYSLMRKSGPTSAYSLQPR